MELVWDNHFRKSYKKRVLANYALKKKFIDKIKLFAEKPFHPSLKSHKLKGKLEGLYAFSVDDRLSVDF
ncbi:MAG: hypothetical protein IEMM0008_0343 [bacterium]|nr:MAG: hypothetical protein IEMM0008_0343 [bacterium]